MAFDVAENLTKAKNFKLRGHWRFVRSLTLKTLESLEVHASWSEHPVININTYIMWKIWDLSSFFDD